MEFTPMEKVVIDGETLTIEDVVNVARKYAQVELSEKARKKIEYSCQVLGQLIEKNAIYGVNTGFGAFGNVIIPTKEIKKLQVNLIRSHSTGVGDPLKTEITRALMLLRANTLSKGFSGIRLETLNTLIQMLNKKVHPIIPEKGSVGASGDLTPLSHMALVMIGEGEAEYNGQVFDGKEAMRRAKISPITLDVKEGVALINGTQMMTAIAALLINDAENLVRTAEVAAALSLEALCGIIDAFDERIQNVRPHKGQKLTAENIRRLVSGSKLIKTGQEAIKDSGYTQDPYTLRCIPQVIGSTRDIVDYIRKIIEIEINSATDNPLVFQQACLSGGNFHGQPISTSMDFLAIALATIGNYSERRIARLVDVNLSRGLPSFLVPTEKNQGLQSGFMTLQYTAAALASENKTLAHPASIDSIPTSANFEDFVSMGPIAARKAAEILHNAQFIIAIELISAAQGVEFRGLNKLGRLTRKAYNILRGEVERLTEDRVMSIDIQAVAGLIQDCMFANFLK
jgi:histidine ammonia-lyase